MIEEVEIACPYCGSTFTSLIDCSAGDQAYIEDCQICCAPIDFSVTVDWDGELSSVVARRGDE